MTGDGRNFSSVARRATATHTISAGALRSPLDRARIGKLCRVSEPSNASTSSLNVQRPLRSLAFESSTLKPREPPAQPQRPVPLGPYPKAPPPLGSLASSAAAASQSGTQASAKGTLRIPKYPLSLPRPSPSCPCGGRRPLASPPNLASPRSVRRPTRGQPHFLPGGRDFTSPIPMYEA